MVERSSLADSGLSYRLLRIANEKFGLIPGELSVQQREESERIAKNEILIEQAVLSCREAAEVFVPEGEVKNAIKQIKGRYESPEEFDNAMHRNGISAEDLSSLVARELKVDAVMNAVSGRVDPVDSDEVNLYYYMNSEKFHHQELRDARHILITINQDFPENEREKALQRISTLRKRLLKDPRRFEEQALKHSECPTSMQGGKLGRLAKGSLYPELDAVLFSLKSGELSEIIESEVGFHIVQCDQIIAPRRVPISEVYEQLSEKLTERKRIKHQRAWLKSILEEPVSTSN